MRTNGLTISGLALAILLTACGGGSATVRTGGPGRATNTGTQVNPAAENAFNDAVAKWRAAERAGWNEERCQEVSDAFKQAAQQNQGGRFPEAWFNAGLALSKCSQTAEGAVALYNKALEAQENYAPARVQLGLLAQKRGDTAAAMAAYERAIRGDAQSVEAYVNLAILQRQRGQGEDMANAQSNLRRALAVDSQYAPAFNQLALLYLDDAERNPQMLKLASIVCKQATTIDPNYAAVYNTWGLVRVREGNIIGALSNFEKAFTLNDRFFEAYMNFGSITLSFRGYEDAKKAFSKAKALHAKNYEARIGLGVALRGLDQIEAAEAEYNGAREVDAQRPDAFFNLALIYQDYKNGTIPDMQKAKGYFGEFSSRASGRPAYARMIEQAQQRTKNIDDTVTALREAEQMERDNAAQQAASEREEAAAAAAAAREQQNAPPAPPPPTKQGGGGN
jgi:tetratricopeptide (TPR) repeat protein